MMRVSKHPFLIFSFIFFLLLPGFSIGQEEAFPFRIRTITAGVNIADFSDIETIRDAINFLKTVRQKYTDKGYEVQTIRIATQHLHEYRRTRSFEDALSFLQKVDAIALEENVIIAVGQVLPPDTEEPNIEQWVERLLETTQNINFSLGISSRRLGIHHSSIKTAAKVIKRLSTIGEGGEANFRFAATAACPPGIPFFPAAYHQGPKGFALGIESPGILLQVFEKSKGEEAKYYLKKALQDYYEPLEALAKEVAQESDYRYNGIDVSTAPGLEASIGQAIEMHTGQPFGSVSTLRTCAMITDVLKNLNLKLCGFSGLMLPVIEDEVLAKRASEGSYSVQELLLYSAVSGTGLDVVPLPGQTPTEVIEGLLEDVAALSLKYTSKPLSVRLFLIPGKETGDLVSFKNPYLTPVKVMKIN